MSLGKNVSVEFPNIADSSFVNDRNIIVTESSGVAMPIS
jgi:hypothetical protein